MKMEGCIQFPGELWNWGQMEDKWVVNSPEAELSWVYWQVKAGCHDSAVMSFLQLPSSSPLAQGSWRREGTWTSKCVYGNYLPLPFLVLPAPSSFGLGNILPPAKISVSFNTWTKKQSTNIPNKHCQLGMSYGFLDVCTPCFPRWLFQSYVKKIFIAVTVSEGHRLPCAVSGKVFRTEGKRKTNQCHAFSKESQEDWSPVWLNSAFWRQHPFCKINHHAIICRIKRFILCIGAIMQKTRMTLEWKI